MNNPKYAIEATEGIDRVTVWNLSAGPGETPAATYDTTAARVKLVSGSDSRGKRAALRRWIVRAARA